jgi:hypothetical protein
MVKSLRPTKQKKFKGKIAGFDIETYSRKNIFLCGSIYFNDNEHIFYWSKDQLINAFKSRRCENYTISATNLAFDFFGLFKLKDVENFDILMRGTTLLQAKTYIYQDRFLHPIERKDMLAQCKNKYEATKLKKEMFYIKFIDTMAYSNASVEKAGAILKVPKMKKPGNFVYNTETESYDVIYPVGTTILKDLEAYNINDSKISKLYLEMLFNSTQDLGGSVKMTIGSSAISLLRCKYLKEEYYTAEKEDILKMLNGFYGGRTECFESGMFDNTYTDWNMYDINSLYPSVMLNEYPNPNSQRHSYKNSTEKIIKYMGISHVKVFCPDIKYPLLPFRTKNKLLFAKGEFEGWYTHEELKKAISIKYKILEVKETYYFKETCKPFHDYVTDLYAKRLEYRKNGNEEMAEICKLFMNSLFGKFGQKFIGRENIVSTKYYNKEYKKMDRYNQFLSRVVEDGEPASFCMPMWSAYITGYARLKLYDYLVEHNAIYCDTDSIIIDHEIATSDKLGDMKLEMKIKKGICIRPKFYGIINANEKKPICKECNIEMDLLDNNYFKCSICNSKTNRNKIKIKGVGKKLSYEELMNTIFGTEHKISFDKFTKIKESMINNTDVNEIIEVVKEFNIQDTKRDWGNNVDFTRLNKSNPIDATNIKGVDYGNQDEYNEFII